MERIVIEVGESVAKAWQDASDEQKRVISSKINLSLAEELMQSGTEYLKFVQELRGEMAAAGLSQSELDKILKDE